MKNIQKKQSYAPAIHVMFCPKFKGFKNFIPYVSFLNIIDCENFEGFKDSNIKKVYNSLNIVNCPKFNEFTEFPETVRFSIRDNNIKKLSGISPEFNPKAVSLEILPQLTDISNLPYASDLLLYHLPKLKNVVIPQNTVRLICKKIKAKPEEILINNPEFRKKLANREVRFEYNDKDITVMLNVGTGENTFWLGKKFLCTESGKTENTSGQKYAF